MKKVLIAIGVIILVVIIGGGIWASQNKPAAQRLAGFTFNWFRYLRAPQGTLQTQTAPGVAAGPAAAVNLAAYDTGKDWASYNKTLTSNRFSPLAQINRSNVSNLKVLCTFNTGEHVGFSTGLLEVQGRLIFTTAFDTFAIDPNNCRQIWKAHENYKAASVLYVNRGAAVMDGRVFRGTQDGRVLAYDLNTGKRLWATQVANPKIGETTPAAPIAWNGMVFIGNAGGDIKGGKGRMYALDAATGKVLWEFYLVPKAPGDKSYGPDAPSPLTGQSWFVPSGQPITGGGTWTSTTLDPQKGLLYVPVGNAAPDFAQGLRQGGNFFTDSVLILDAKTGAFRGYYKTLPIDWHDWDVSSTPALIHTAGGRNMMVVTPKDGHLYAWDLDSRQQLYRVAVTRIENPDVPFEVGKSVHFCPGTVGGSEWNGATYDPANNLVLAPQIQWCATVTIESRNATINTKTGAPWSAQNYINPFNTWGKFDPPFDWAGWVYAVDADTGKWRWRAKSNYPVQSGVTPTQGGLVFFGDMGGDLYALDSATGQKLWGRKLDGAVGGGVITYDAGEGQRVAAATGLTEVLWPTQVTTAKVMVLGV